MTCFPSRRVAVLGISVLSLVASSCTGDRSTQSSPSAIATIAVTPTPVASPSFAPTSTSVPTAQAPTLGPVPTTLTTRTPTVASPTIAPTPRPSPPWSQYEMTFSDGVPTPRVPYILDARVVAPPHPTAPVTLGSNALCSAGPSLSADGGMLVHDDRLLDLATGRETSLGTRACWASWSRSGRLAYLRLASTATPDRHIGTIVVRSADGTAAVDSSDEGIYGRLRWAGDILLAERAPIGRNPYYDLVALEPGVRQARLLATNAEVIAVSPLGDRVVITTIPDPITYGAWETIHLLRVSDGKEIASQVLSDGATLEALATSGEWRGDTVVTKVGVYPGGTSHPGPALVVLRVTDSSIAITGQYRPNSPLVGPGPFADFSQIHFLDDRVIAAAFGFYAYDRYLECDLVTRSCVVGPSTSGYRLLSLESPY